MQSRTDPQLPKPDALHLWRVLRHYIEHACSLIGMPAQIAKRLWLSRAEHDYLASVVRPLEDLLRRLIFLLAAKLPPEPPKPEAKLRPRKAMRAAFGASFDAENSDTWRTRLHFLKRGRSRPLEQQIAASQPIAAPEYKTIERDADGRRLYAAAPLALRLEAIIRGFNDPEPLARQLARQVRQEPCIAEDYAAPLPKREHGHPLAPSLEQVRVLCDAEAPARSSPDSS